MNPCKECEEKPIAQEVDIRIQGNYIARIKVIACPLHLEMMQDILGDFDHALTDVSKHWESVINAFEVKIDKLGENMKAMDKKLEEWKH